MLTRTVLAYLLIALMLAYFAGVVAWKWYYSYRRTDQRRRARDREAYHALIARREADASAADGEAPGV